LLATLFTLLARRVLMIDRLVTSLQQLAVLPAPDLGTSASTRLRGDCADAVRLELDCPQLSLTPDQRAVLSRLSDALEQPGAPSAEILMAVQAPCAALGLSAGEHRLPVT
jgi:hypothetical protein